MSSSNLGWLLAYIFKLVWIFKGSFIDDVQKRKIGPSFLLFKSKSKATVPRVVVSSVPRRDGVNLGISLSSDSLGPKPIRSPSIVQNQHHNTIVPLIITNKFARILQFKLFLNLKVINFITTNEIPQLKRAKD